MAEESSLDRRSDTQDKLVKGYIKPYDDKMKLLKRHNEKIRVNGYNDRALATIAYVMGGSSPAAAKILGIPTRRVSKLVSSALKNVQDYLDAPIKYDFDEHPTTRRELFTANFGYVIGLYLKQLGAPEIVSATNAREAADVCAKLMDKLLTLLGKPSTIVATVNTTLPMEAVNNFLESLGYAAHSEDIRPARIPQNSAGAQKPCASEPTDAEFTSVGDTEVPSVSPQGDTGTPVEAVPQGVAGLAGKQPVHPDTGTQGTREVNGMLGGL